MRYRDHGSRAVQSEISAPPRLPSRPSCHLAAVLGSGGLQETASQQEALFWSGYLIGAHRNRRRGQHRPAGFSRRDARDGLASSFPATWAQSGSTRLFLGRSLSSSSGHGAAEFGTSSTSDIVHKRLVGARGGFLGLVFSQESVAAGYQERNTTNEQAPTASRARPCCFFSKGSATKIGLPQKLAPVCLTSSIVPTRDVVLQEDVEGPLNVPSRRIANFLALGKNRLHPLTFILRRKLGCGPPALAQRGPAPPRHTNGKVGLAAETQGGLASLSDAAWVQADSLRDADITSSQELVFSGLGRCIIPH